MSLPSARYGFVNSPNRIEIGRIFLSNLNQCDD